MARVLLIEDDRGVREGMSLALRRQGHEVTTAANGEHGLAQWRAVRPDVIILDLMLPGLSGLDVCTRIRTHDEVPIIMATARGDDVDVIVGLELGADDYVIKPVRARVLDARVRAVLRRTTQPVTVGMETYGDLVIDRKGLTVSQRGRSVGLARSELMLLLTLSASPGQVFSRQQLLQAVWDHSYHGDLRLVDACVKRLRTKLDEPARAPRYIRTVRGFGYHFIDPASAGGLVTASTAADGGAEAPSR